MQAERHGPTAMELRGVSLERGGRTVLTGISASFQRHAVSAIVGPSGAGKTSLLRCLNRLEEPTIGSILLDSSGITAVDPIQLRRRVGMIFQTPSLFPGSVRGNLAYGMTNISDDELREALASTALDDGFLERDSGALSVGQAQRVCIARALVRGPEILLMDEPTSALDRDAAGRIEQLVTSLNETGLTVVLVTHNLDQALRLAHHAILLVDGRLVAAGAPREVSRAWPRERSS